MRRGCARGWPAFGGVNVVYDGICEMSDIEIDGIRNLATKIASWGGCLMDSDGCVLACLGEVRLKGFWIGVYYGPGAVSQWLRQLFFTERRSELVVIMASLRHISGS